MNEFVLEEVKRRFGVVEMDAGEFSEINENGMHFHVEVYSVEGAGKLFLMDMKGMAGLMKMETVTFTPTSLDGPILSVDKIDAMGQHTLVLELYDTTLSHPEFMSLNALKEKFAALPPYDPGEHHYYRFRMPQSDYKKGIGIKKQVSDMAELYCGAYFDELQNCALVDSEEKKRVNKEFSNELFEYGGSAVDQFKKMIGEEKTKRFLLEYMF